MENMSTLQFRERIHQRRERGEPVPDDEITAITNKSAELAGEPEGPQGSVHPEQVGWASAADQILSKPVNTITMNDARILHAKETRAYERLPAQGSVSSHVTSVAEKNENYSA